jgi:hypothetical protein
MALALANVQTAISATNGDAEPVLLTTLALPSITAGAGSVLINGFTVGDDNNARTPSTTDTKSQTYTGIGSILRDAADSQLLYCSYTPNAGAGATVANSNISAANGYIRTIIAEISGVDAASPVGAPVAVQAGSTTSGTMTLSPITPTKNGNWIVAFWLEIQNVGDFSAPAGWSVAADVHVTLGQKAAQLLMLYKTCPDLTPISPAVASSGVGDIYHAMAFELRQPLPPPQPPTPVMWLTTTPGPTPGQTYEQARSYADIANRPPVTGTTRDFTSSSSLLTQLGAAAPGDLVRYVGTGLLTLPGFNQSLCLRRYANYVNIDLGLKSSPNHVVFSGGGGPSSPACAIFGSQYLRIYGGEITNPGTKANGHDGLHIYGADHAGVGSTNHITWWNLVVHDTVDSGIKMLPNVPFTSSPQTAADNTIADCDIEAEVYAIGLDKTADTHPEPGTGQHCCVLADTDPVGSVYPSFLRNRVAIDGHDTGLVSSQGGGSVCEIGFNDAPSTISACALILRGNNMNMVATLQTAGNCLNTWGSATIDCDVPFIQHHNSQGSGVHAIGSGNSAITVEYGRHSNICQNPNNDGPSIPWQAGPVYVDVD